MLTHITIFNEKYVFKTKKSSERPILLQFSLTGLTAANYGHVFASAFHLLWYVILVEEYEETSGHTEITLGTSKRVLGPLLRIAVLEGDSYTCPFHSLLKVIAQTSSFPSFPHSRNRNKEKERAMQGSTWLTVLIFFWGGGSFLSQLPHNYRFFLV